MDPGGPRIYGSHEPMPWRLMGDPSPDEQLPKKSFQKPSSRPVWPSHWIATWSERIKMAGRLRRSTPRGSKKTSHNRVIATLLKRFRFYFTSTIAVLQSSLTFLTFFGLLLPSNIIKPHTAYLQQTGFNLTRWGPTLASPRWCKKTCWQCTNVSLLQPWVCY